MLVFSKGRKKVWGKKTKPPKPNKQKAVPASVMVGKLRLSNSSRGTFG